MGFEEDEQQQPPTYVPFNGFQNPPQAYAPPAYNNPPPYVANQANNQQYVVSEYDRDQQYIIVQSKPQPDEGCLLVVTILCVVGLCCPLLWLCAAFGIGSKNRSARTIGIISLVLFILSVISSIVFWTAYY